MSLREITQLSEFLSEISLSAPDLSRVHLLAVVVLIGQPFKNRAIAYLSLKNA
ncbi:hypothetical protein H6G00_25910 [Leptolyngbya sp. FACHB-541]|nr:hypothetical protein [Leptolyngbya sp. FACHB-541]